MDKDTSIRQTMNASRRLVDRRLTLCIRSVNPLLRDEGFMGRFEALVK